MSFSGQASEQNWGKFGKYLKEFQIKGFQEFQVRVAARNGEFAKNRERDGTLNTTRASYEVAESLRETGASNRKTKEKLQGGKVKF